MVEGAHFLFRNPNTDNIEDLFTTLGLPGILNNIHWNNTSNKSMRLRLNAFVRMRNYIAHGQSIPADFKPMHKSTVKHYEKFTMLLAESLDAKVGGEVATLSGRPSW